MFSKMSAQFSRIPTHYQSILILCIWGGAILFFGAIRLDAFALDEGAAHALILNWSISDQIINPVATYGGPDFRALLFIPLGTYWPGSILAAKVFTIIMMFAGCMGLYYWSRSTQNEEVALIATGLLLISPVTLQLIDNIAVGPCLIMLFGAGAWLNKKYRASPHAISSQYFLQCILIAITVTLHPMGLAYPIALAWHWYKHPKTEGENPGKQQKQVWLGIGTAVFIVLAMQTGWISLTWFSDPVASLNQALLDSNINDPGDETLWAGAALLALLALVVFNDIKSSLKDLLGNMMGSMLIISLLLGLLVADMNWALIAFAYLLFRGLPQLIQLNKKTGLGNFVGQRGLVMVAIIVLSSVFLSSNKLHASIIKTGILSAEDSLIQTLALEAQNRDELFLAASQWPARTMIVCRRDVLKLPPATETGEALLASIRGITHIMYNHHNPRFSTLSKNFSEITASTETLSMQDGGVIIRIKQAAKKETAHKEKPAEPPTEAQAETATLPGSDVPGIVTEPVK